MQISSKVSNVSLESISVEAGRGLKSCVKLDRSTEVTADQLASDSGSWSSESRRLIVIRTRPSNSMLG